MSLVQTLGTPDVVVPRGARRRSETNSDALQRRTVFQSIVATWRRWHERRTARHALESLSAHTLRDIGVTRELVDYDLWRSIRRRPLDRHVLRSLYGGDAPSTDLQLGPEAVRDTIYREPRL